MAYLSEKASNSFHFNDSYGKSTFLVFTGNVPSRLVTNNQKVAFLEHGPYLVSIFTGMDLPTFEPNYEKPTLWTLRNVSTQIRLRSPRRLIRVDTFRLRGDNSNS